MVCKRPSCSASRGGGSSRWRDMSPELGILVADEAWLERAAALVRKPQQTHLFLMDDAVRGLERIRAVVDQGADVTVCATDASRFGVEPTAGVRFGSQYDHA